MSLNTAALGATVQYVTPAGSTFTGLPENFSVSITTAANSITFVFNDYTNDPTADTQGISGLALILSGSFNGTPTITSHTGTLEKIAADGTWAVDTTDTITQWAASNAGINSNATTIYMSVFSGGTPQDLVLGGPDATSVYTSANNSIAGSKHNPFIKQTATFVVSLTGVLSTTQVSGATFNFGTAQGLCLGGTTNQCVSGMVATPEPGTSVMFLIAFAGMGIGCARKKVRKAA